MQCPVCKADNAQGPLCRRCKADLSLLFQLEVQREQNLAQAWQSLRDGRWQDGVRLAQHADGLRSDAESRQLLAVVSLLTRSFAEALRNYHSIDDVTSSEKEKAR